jgi:hypothetical protein
MVISSGGRFREALSLMEQAIEHDPDYGPALAWAAFCHMRACQDGRSEDPEADGRIGIDLARRRPATTPARSSTPPLPSHISRALAIPFSQLRNAIPPRR